jgi:ribosomal protein S18 acetylase RimI-like enzyme
MTTPTLGRTLRPTLREATADDRDGLLAMAHAFAVEDGHGAYGAGNDAALLGLLDRPDDGRVLLLESDGEAVGYAVLCFGYSVEYGGRDAFLDEIYVVPAARGRGIARAALELLADLARAAGVGALHVEVMPDNDRAARLYERAGWVDRRSRLLTRSLDRG